MGDDDASVMLLTASMIRPTRAAPVRVLQQVACSNPVAARPPAAIPGPRRGPGPGRGSGRGRGRACGACFRAVTVPARPGRADVDPLLAGPVRRLVVAGTDADLAAVLVRLLRRDRLDVELAYIPADHRSAAARSGGCPAGRRPSSWPARASRGRHRWCATTRVACWWAAEIRGATGSVHGEAYCDGLLVLRGSARRLVVTPRADAAPSPGGIAEPAPPASPCGRAAGARSPTAGRPVPPAARAGRERPSGVPSRSAACPPPSSTTAWRTPAGHPLGLVPARDRRLRRPVLAASSQTWPRPRRDDCPCDEVGRSARTAVTLAGAANRRRRIALPKRAVSGTLRRSGCRPVRGNPPVTQRARVRNTRFLAFTRTSPRPRSTALPCGAEDPGTCAPPFPVDATERHLA